MESLTISFITIGKNANQLETENFELEFSEKEKLKEIEFLENLKQNCFEELKELVNKLPTAQFWSVETLQRNIISLTKTLAETVTKLNDLND
jgi:CRISPR/Cas system CSM-associated protein Csm2 small subunit